MEPIYLERASRLCHKVIADFGDSTGGFYLYSKQHEKLILRPKKTYDGAIPSGNSLMAYNLVRLSLLIDEEQYRTDAENQLDFLAKDASQYPLGYAMFLIALLEYEKPPMKITVVLDKQTDKSALPTSLPQDAVVILLPQPTKEYPLKNDKTTYYICCAHSCLAQINDLNDLI